MATTTSTSRDESAECVSEGGARRQTHQKVPVQKARNAQGFRWRYQGGTSVSALRGSERRKAVGEGILRKVALVARTDR